MFEFTVSNSETKLPTLKQYLKDNPQEGIATWSIDKILWGEKYKSITFFTIAFRYSVKFASKEEYDKACGMVLDEFQMQGAKIVGQWELTLDCESDKVMVGMTPLRDGGTYAVWKQFDWGLVTGNDELVKYKKPKTKPAKDSNPPAS